MLATLSQYYSTVGIDSSKEMLRIAKKKAPRSRLILGDITSFKLPERFDVILCPFDTINHITSFADWRRVFTCAHRHLNPGGIFIFDVNTEHKMEEYRLDPVQAEVSPKSVSIVQVTRQARFNYTVHLRLFQKTSAKNYRLQEMNLPELVVPTKRICAALSRHFSSVTLIDPDRARPTKYTEELYFVCQNPR